jgi:hypothetical protein
MADASTARNYPMSVPGPAEDGGAMLTGKSQATETGDRNLIRRSRVSPKVRLAVQIGHPGTAVGVAHWVCFWQKESPRGAAVTSAFV